KGRLRARPARKGTLPRSPTVRAMTIPLREAAARGRTQHTDPHMGSWLSVQGSQETATLAQSSLKRASAASRAKKLPVVRVHGHSPPAFDFYEVRRDPFHENPLLSGIKMCSPTVPLECVYYLRRWPRQPQPSQSLLLRSRLPNNQTHLPGPL